MKAKLMAFSLQKHFKVRGVYDISLKMITVLRYIQRISLLHFQRFFLSDTVLVY